MSSPTGLLSCSNEVLTIVFSDSSLECKDIKSLRLTCKDLQPNATRLYAERYLTEPFFILSRYSLRSLVEICQHPLLSPHIRTIGIVTTTLHVEGLKERIREISEKRWGHQVAAADFAVVTEYARICQEQVELEESGEARVLLTRALSTLQHPITIKITNDLESMGTIEVIGLPPTTYVDYKYTGVRHYNFMDRDSKMRSLFKLVQQALAEVDFEDRKLFTALEVTMRRRSQLPKPSHGYQDYIGGLQNISRFYSGLKSFRLDMDLQALQSQESLISLDHLFRAAPNLRELSFRAGCSGRRAIGPHSLKRISKLFDVATKFELRALNLQEVACTLEALRALMQRHKQTLIDINFTKVTLLGSWEDCLSWIQQELNLENFHLEQAYTVDGVKTASKGGFKPTAESFAMESFKGKQSTRAGLDNMISTTPAP